MLSLISYLLIPANLILGLLIVIGFNQWHSSTWLIRSLVVLLVFVLLNLAYVFLFRLKKEIIEFWSLRKILFLPAGMIGGAFIASVPKFISLCSGNLLIEEIVFKPVTLYSVILTFAIVGWEELWFRGIWLNYCHRQLSGISISLMVGLLFMLMHALNPDINLLEKGPTLFFAGALLTLLYFYYRTIWLPLGLHFGNNFLGSSIETWLDAEPVVGKEGYLEAGILMILYILFVKLTLNKSSKAKFG